MRTNIIEIIYKCSLKLFYGLYCLFLLKVIKGPFFKSSFLHGILPTCKLATGCHT